MADDHPTSGATRLGAVLAILIGAFGALCGLSGAGTFIPYRLHDQLSMPVAEALTGLSALAAALSVAGVYYGWSMLRGRERAWLACLAIAACCVATVAAFAAIMPPTSPSPVPGSPGTPVLFAVVAAAYGVEALLLGLRPRPRPLDPVLRPRGGGADAGRGSGGTPPVRPAGPIRARQSGMTRP